MLSENEAHELLQHYVSDYREPLKEVVYFGDYGYATDGRIALKVHTMSSEDTAPSHLPGKIDEFMAAFALQKPMPPKFASRVLCKDLREKFDEKVAECVKDSRADLEDITRSPCPHCGKDILIDSDGEIVSEERYKEMEEEATDAVARRNVHVPVAFLVQPSAAGQPPVRIIVNYRYARLLVYAVGKDGEYRYGHLKGSGDAVWGRSKDGDRECVLMQMRKDDNFKGQSDMPTVELFDKEEGGVK